MVALASSTSDAGYALSSPGSNRPLHRRLRVTQMRVVVEVDGGQHGARSAADEERTKVLEANGYRVLRYWNNDVLTNINGVLEDILSAITTTPTPNPSPQGSGCIACVGK
jgi:Protein of unknown function (DUF559)